MTRDIRHLRSVSAETSNCTLISDSADGAEIGSASGQIAKCRAKCEQQGEVNYRHREQSPCGRSRPSQYELQPKVQEPETQQPSNTIKNSSVLCRGLHDAEGDKSEQWQQGFHGHER